MARRKARAPDGPSLYELQERAEIRRIRRQHALFIPRFLTKAAQSLKLADTDRDRAYTIAVRWAELETSGQLAQAKETEIGGQFLDQLFGEGLGHVTQSAGQAEWQLQHQFAVPGVGAADGALGEFPKARSPAAVIELKDALTDLDRDRSNGRTAVQQCWDYLNALPDCPWGIVSNFATIRLYHRSKGILSYEEFSLQELRDPARFNEFYYLFAHGGLLPSRAGQKPRAAALLEETSERQKQVGDDLYDSYQLKRLLLIEHLMKEYGKPLDSAIRIAQKLLDRIIFIAFCEDRDLLREKCLERAAMDDHGAFGRRNPRWNNFLGLFREVDRGGKLVGLDAGYNGGLFARDDEIDALDLDDDPWALHFKGFGDYDFAEEVNVDVLGRLFERSITELEKLRVGGLFALKASLDAANGNGPAAKPARGKKAPKQASVAETSASRMPKSAQRKRFGIYYTPPAFTGLIVERTVDAVVKERFAALAQQHNVDPEARQDQDVARLRAYWSACLDALKAVTVCDPACGSGAFLIRAYDALDAHYKAVVHGLAGAGAPADEVKPIEDAIPDMILNNNLFGVDLSVEAVEITQLALWIRSARQNRTLADLSRHIIHGNSLVADPAVDPKALDWRRVFPTIFGPGGPGGFACVIGNPPWERVKVQEREFFSLTDPATAEAVSAADRRKRIAALPKANPDLHAAYEAAQSSAERMLTYARECGDYPLTGKGDVNLYMLFAELAPRIVAPDGVVGLLLPSGIATDDSTKEFFQRLMDEQLLVSLYDFENRDRVFEDVDNRFKFSALVFGGAKRKTAQADFVFFARSVAEVAAAGKKRHIPLTAADMRLFNPNTRTCPIFRTRRDADLTRAIYKRVPILIDENRRAGGNPWGIKFVRMFDQTNDAEHFHEAKHWEKRKYTLRGNVYVHGKKRALPLYEAKMVQAFDHRAASVVVDTSNWFRQGQKDETGLAEHQNPEFLAAPRWWVQEATVLERVTPPAPPAFLAFKNVTSPTNTRSMIAAFVPFSAVGNSAPLVLLPPELPVRTACCLLGDLNALVLDYVARNKIGNVNLNFFIIEQLPMLHPFHYDDKCPWSKKETLERWISERVLKLTCTAEDMIPLAQACGFAGSRGDGVHIWKEAERAELRAELDAAYFILYGIGRDDAEYILSTFTHTGFIAEEERVRPDDCWVRGGIGERTLAALERLSEAAK